MAIPPSSTSASASASTPKRSILRQSKLDMDPSPLTKPRADSAPVIHSQRPSIPTHPYGARDRFSSLPVTVPEIDMERDRLLRACGHPPHMPSPSPRSPAQVDAVFQANIERLPLAPTWPHGEVLQRLHTILHYQGRHLKQHLDFDDVEKLAEECADERERSVESFEEQRAMREGEWNPLWSSNSPFDAPIYESAFWASTTVVMNGARHDVPTVMYACIEELYRTGIYQPNLFRETPHLQRHADLFKIFDTAPAFGHGVSLRRETTAVIAAVLSTFLRNLRQPILCDPLREALWNFCVQPTVERERLRMAAEQDEVEDARRDAALSERRQSAAYIRETAARKRVLDEENKMLDLEQVPTAQCLMRLMPTSRLSALYYLCAFFSQTPLCPDNGLDLEDIGALFADRIIGGPIPNARAMLVWLLRYWTEISDGLLNEDLGPEPVDPFLIPEPTPRSVYADETMPQDCVVPTTPTRQRDSAYSMNSPSSRRRSSYDSRKRSSAFGASDVTLAQSVREGKKPDLNSNYADDAYTSSVPTIQPVPAHARRLSRSDSLSLSPTSLRPSPSSTSPRRYTHTSSRVESLPPIVSVDIVGGESDLLADIKAELMATRMERDRLRDERDHALAVVDDALAAIDASRLL
ncbi:unnamed protein product [Peniophora sp. CBMAI 1063]|nr:unnamed protein product [Peniophora sp. CBMAI 1063]